MTSQTISSRYYRHSYQTARTAGFHSLRWRSSETCCNGLWEDTSRSCIGSSWRGLECCCGNFNEPTGLIWNAIIWYTSTFDSKKPKLCKTSNLIPRALVVFLLVLLYIFLQQIYTILREKEDLSVWFTPNPHKTEMNCTSTFMILDAAISMNHFIFS